MLYQVPELTPDDLAVMEAIDKLRATLRFDLARPRRWRGTLRRQLKAEAVRGSNSIEGIEVTEDQAFAIVSGEDEQVQVDRTWLAVKGYSDAMTYARILGQDPGFAMDESTLRALQFMVDGHSLQHRPGQYRAGDIHVVEEGTARTVYTGPDAEDVPGLMEEYVTWLNSSEVLAAPPLIQAAMAHLNLVMIHPFGDGNGRTSRIVQSLVLYRDGRDEADLVSIEEYLGKNTQQYYAVLAEVGRGSWPPVNSASAWIEFVLTAHYRQIRSVQRRVDFLSTVGARVDELVATLGLPERAAPALETTFAGWALRNATYRDIVEVSANVASRELASLVTAGVLERKGAKRGTRYLPGAAHREWIADARASAEQRHPELADPYRALRRGEALA